jgi:hypothetical protein
MFDPPVIIDSGSSLVRTAVELAQRHSPRPGIDDEPWCVRCWAPWPCVAARHAAEVCEAAGIDSTEPYWLEQARPEPSPLDPSWLGPSLLNELLTSAREPGAAPDINRQPSARVFAGSRTG